MIDTEQDLKEKAEKFETLLKEINWISHCFWSNKCPECRNPIEDDYCDKCEQKFDETSLWIGLIDIIIDNHLD